MVLIALNAVFACAEIAVLSVNEVKLSKMVSEGSRKEWDLADWVLSRYPKEVEADVENGIKKACDAVACIMNEGIESGMNKYNG